MNVLKSDKNMAKLYVQSFRPKSEYQCKNELIFIRDFEAVQKTRSRVFSRVRTLSFAPSF